MKRRLILGYLIGYLPFNFLRVFLYNVFFQYKISNSIISWGTVIVVVQAIIIDSFVDKFNRFVGPIDLTIKRKASIGKSNFFHCGVWVLEKAHIKNNYKRYLEIGENTRISPKNYFDVAGSFILGNNSRIAGRGSQFWTHGESKTDRDVTIGADCFIGSAVRFSPGSSIGNNCMVGLGSVVTKKFNIDQALIGGAPAKILRTNYNWKIKTVSKP